jgi:hypothetical protein
MTWTLQAAKARLGITDDAQDAQITQALNVSLGLAEKYCDRRFQKKDETARFFGDSWPTLLVRRYPILSVAEVRAPTGDVIDSSRYGIDYDNGMILLGSGNMVVPSRWSRGAVEVDFTGGYEPLPDDLELALWLVFDAVWFKSPGMGLPGGTAPEPTVRSFAIDGMSIGYENAATVSGSPSSGGGPAAWGLMPASSVATLNLYRAETAWGGA